MRKSDDYRWVSPGCQKDTPDIITFKYFPDGKNLQFPPYESPVCFYFFIFLKTTIYIIRINGILLHGRASGPDGARQSSLKSLKQAQRML
jgi:hypothetical protein